MALTIHIFTIVSWLLALGWLWQAVGAARGVPQLPDLTCIDPNSMPALADCDGAHLTVIVPALNEENSIEATLRSLLASSGLRLEIIAVNDRSTDSTGKKMDAIAAQAKAESSPHSLQVIHIDSLPAGWLGKPHAMALASQQATTPWLLFTDGDVLFKPRALELAMREAVALDADHLVLMPTAILKATGERAVLAAMQAIAQWTVRLWKVSDPSARDSIGVGGFNLLRRGVYEQIGGFEALRMEVLEDRRLGWIIKRAGYKQRAVLGPDLVRVRWMKGSLAVIGLMEKNAFAAFRYKVGITVLASIGLALYPIVTVAAVFAGSWSLATSVVAIHFAIGMAYAASRRITRVSPWHIFFFAPAAALLNYAIVRSMILALVRNGIDWRGTRYSLSDLRRHAGSGW
jgi:glycosyltransferase involved in cell wall biosynthesis